MKKRISIDSLMNQTLGFNTKSFSESKSIKNVNKKFNYGELGRAMLVFEIDKYAMIAEAATLKADLATMVARGESKIIDKVKGAGKVIVDAVIKLFQALRDMIKNFLARNKDSQKTIKVLIKELETMEEKNRKNELLSEEKCKKAEKKGVLLTMIDNDDSAQDDGYSFSNFGVVKFPKKIKGWSLFFNVNNIENYGIDDFLNDLIPNGSDESLSAIEYGIKLKDSLEPDMKEMKDITAKIRRNGPKMITLNFRDGINPLVNLIEYSVKIARITMDSGHDSKEFETKLTETIENLKNYRDKVTIESGISSASDVSMTKARFSLHAISNYFTVYMDAENLSKINITKCMLMTIKTIKPLCK